MASEFADACLPEPDGTFDMLKLDHQLCFPLYACSRKIVNLYTPHLKELGLTYTQYLVFLVLWEEDHIRVGDLCRRLYLDTGTVTPLLKKMEKEGYINRIRKKDDERIVLITLTKKGLSLREKASSIPGRIGNKISLSEEEALNLYQLLYKVLDLCK